MANILGPALILLWQDDFLGREIRAYGVTKQSRTTIAAAELAFIIDKIALERPQRRLGPTRLSMG